MDRYTIQHGPADLAKNPLLPVTYTTIEAETGEEARARFTAENPGRMITDCIRQTDRKAAFERYGLGAWTEAERDAYRANLARVYDRARTEAEAARQTVSEYSLEELAADLEYHTRRAAETTPNADGVHVGDLFYSSWGYDQTNIDFYEVVALRGKKTAVIRRCEAKSELCGNMTGCKRPIRGRVFGEEYTVKTKIHAYHGGPCMNDPRIGCRHLLTPVEPGKLYSFSTYA